MSSFYSFRPQSLLSYLLMNALSNDDLNVFVLQWLSYGLKLQYCKRYRQRWKRTFRKPCFRTKDYVSFKVWTIIFTGRNYLVYFYFFAYIKFSSRTLTLWFMKRCSIYFSSLLIKKIPYKKSTGWSILYWYNPYDISLFYFVDSLFINVAAWCAVFFYNKNASIQMFCVFELF